MQAAAVWRKLAPCGQFRDTLASIQRSNSMKIRIGDFEHWTDAIKEPCGDGGTGADIDYEQATLTKVEPVQDTCRIHFEAEHKGRVCKFSFDTPEVAKILVALLSENIGKKNVADLANLTIIL
jgi:hypothetical protein